MVPIISGFQTPSPNRKLTFQQIWEDFDNAALKLCTKSKSPNWSKINYLASSCVTQCEDENALIVILHQMLADPKIRWSSVFSLCVTYWMQMCRKCPMFAPFFRGELGRRTGKSILRIICQIDKNQAEDEWMNIYIYIYIERETERERWGFPICSLYSFKTRIIFSVPTTCKINTNQ